jgi:uncharacterized Fe-S center protein
VRHGFACGRHRRGVAFRSRNRRFLARMSTPAKVFFAAVSENESTDSICAKVRSLVDAAGFSQLFQKGDLVAVKTHFGERGNQNYTPAKLQAPVIDRVKKLGGKPFWTDTNTLYVGERSNAVDHLALAHEHGFSLETTGAPVVIADGVSGREETLVAIHGKHAKEVGIAPGVAAADALLVMTHATGHLACGYGGVIKNIGMGLSSRKGKLYQHSVVKPRVNSAKCRGDEACVRWCPEKAISMTNKKAVIDANKCIGCGECIAACRPGAVSFQWKIEARMLQERMAEQAYGVFKQKQGRIGFMTFIINVGKDCDCLATRPRDVILKAVGIVASLDPVAIEYATLSLIEKALGNDLRNRAYDIDYFPQLIHAEELGMGTRRFELCNSSSKKNGAAITA